MSLRRTAAVCFVFVTSFALLTSSVSAQDPGTAPVSPQTTELNAAPVSVILRIKDDKPLHFGEMIQLELQYVASRPGYVRAEATNKLTGYHPWRMECQPDEQIIDRHWNSGQVNAQPFYYSKPGCPNGVGGSGASGCADCGGEITLGKEPISFPISLNYDFQFLKPGRYVCTEHTADVTAKAKAPDEERTAIAIDSNPLTLDIADDPTWSAETLTKTLLDLKTARCNDGPDKGLRCSELASTIRFLDTEESLRVLVQLYQGKEELDWRHQAWLGILQTRHAQLRLDLIEKRMQEPDFAVTTGFLDTLVAFAIQRDTPEAFDADTPAKDGSPYYAASLSLLRGYLKLVGDSLPNKQGEARQLSLETYKGYARSLFCEDDPLIAPAEMERVLSAASTNH